MENRLADAAKQQYESVVKESTAALSATLTARAKKFDGKSLPFSNIKKKIYDAVKVWRPAPNWNRCFDPSHKGFFLFSPCKKEKKRWWIRFHGVTPFYSLTLSYDECVKVIPLAAKECSSSPCLHEERVSVCLYDAEPPLINNFFFSQERYLKHLFSGYILTQPPSVFSSLLYHVSRGSRLVVVHPRPLFK